MGQTYTRQSSFADGDTITAALFNNEYNQLVNAFSYSATNAATTGHRHDGSAGEGGNIPQIGDLDFLNKIVVDSTNNRWGFYVQVSTNTVEQIRLQDGVLLPVTDSDVDLGTTGLRFKDAYIDTVTTTGNVAVGGNLTVTGTTTFNGGTITMGDAATDNVVFGADVDSNIIPDDDDTYDLGSSTQEWRNLYIDGTANIDSLVADTADINGGTIDGAVIGGSSAAAITGTTITGTAITGTSFVIGSATITEAELEILDGATVTTDELNILDGVTATTAELNIMDGVTSTAAELNILDGVTSTATELNLLDGVTSTTAELNILDGVTASAADINLIDGITNGTVIASKAIVTDVNKDITGGRNITISGELDAATLDISGNADIDGTLEADAITIGGITLAETISDTVGAMVTSNTESGITVAYDDLDNTLDFTVGTLNQDTTGSAATLTTPRAIAVAGDVTGTANFDGSAGISITTTLATDAIVTANITNANVTLAKMAANSVDSDQYVDGSIDTVHIADSQITSAKIADGTIATGDIADDAVTGAKLANNIDIAGTLDVTGVLTADSNVVIAGDLTVQGDTTTLNTATLDVEDKNITLNKGSGDTSGSANGAGLTIQDAVDASNDATILWDTTNDEFDFSHPINVAGKVTSTGTSVFASLDISGDIDVDGTTNLDVVDIDGAVDMASTLQVDGVATFTSTPVFSSDITVNDDIFLTTDSAAIKFGNGQEVTLTHTNDVGLTLNSSNRFMFRDSAIYLSSTQDGQLTVVADTEIELNATTIDINGNILASGTLGATGVLTANAGVVVDNITIDGNEIDVGSGDLTLDVAGDIILNADGGDIKFQDGGSNVGSLINSSGFVIKSDVSDADIKFQGVDDASTITALTLDMSDGGTAIFGGWQKMADNNRIVFGAGSDLSIYSDGTNGQVLVDGNLTLDVAGDILLDADGGDVVLLDGGTEFGRFEQNSNNFRIKSSVSNADILLMGSDGGSAVTALTLDMSAAGAATFNSTITAGANSGVIKEIGSDLSLVQGAVGLRINDAASAISATTATANSDGAVDLGVSNIRFKRLYLADGITDSGSAGSTTVFNDGATTADFRVESTSNPHMLFIDGGNNEVSIGSSQTSKVFNVVGDFENTGFYRDYAGAGTGANYVYIGRKDTNGDLVDGVRISGGGDNAVAASHTGYFELAINKSGTFIPLLYSSNGTSLVVNENSADLDFRVESNGNANMLFVDGGANRVGVGITPTETLHVNGRSRIQNLYLGEISSNLDIIQATSSAGLYLIGGGSDVTLGTTGFIFNEGSADKDFRVESNGNTHMLFVDGGNDTVKLGNDVFGEAPTASSGDFVHFNTGAISVSSNASSTVNLFTRSPNSEVSACGTVFVAGENSGGSIQFGVIIDFFFSNGSFSTTARETGSSQGTVTTSVQENGDAISVTVAYGGGLGGAVRYSAGGQAAICSY